MAAPETPAGHDDVAATLVTHHPEYVDDHDRPEFTRAHYASEEEALAQAKADIEAGHDVHSIEDPQGDVLYDLGEIEKRTR